MIKIKDKTYTEKEAQKLIEDLLDMVYDKSNEIRETNELLADARKEINYLRKQVNSLESGVSYGNIYNLLAADTEQDLYWSIKEIAESADSPRLGEAVKALLV